MWLLSPVGFFSIVRKPSDAAKGTLTVRARVRSDLDALRTNVLPELGATKVSDENDYRYRAQAPQSAVAAAMAKLVEQLDYSNFKAAVAQRQGAPRASLYHRVWDVLHELQGSTVFDAAVPKPRTGKIGTVPVADCYGGVLMTASGKVLLREPQGHYGSYVWTLAKGRPQPGEAPERTALREVKEETGYEARVVAPIAELFPGTTSTTAFFLMEAIGQAGDHSEETASVRWVDAAEAVELISKTRTRTGRNRDLGVLKAAQNMFDGLSLPQRPAVRQDDWQNRPMPEQSARLPLDLWYDATGMTRIRQGFLPTVMEEKWFAWFDQDVLHLHRSWTGFCIYQVRFRSEGPGARAVEALVNRDPEQYSNQNDDEDIRLIADLIDGLLLNGPKWPREDGLVAGLKLAMKPNYLGSPEVVSALVAKLVDAVVRKHRRLASHADVLAARDEVSKALAGCDSAYTVMPSWHTADQLGRAMVEYLNLDADYFVDEELSCICSEALSSVARKVKEMLNAFEADPAAEWEPHGLLQLNALADFVTHVLLGTNALKDATQTLRAFEWTPVA